MSCSSSNGGYDQIICNPSDKKIENGDILIIDTGTTLDGYFCDFDRNYGFGNITEQANKAYQILWEASEKAFEKARPGYTCADISNTMNAVLNKYNTNLKKLNEIIDVIEDKLLADGFTSTQVLNLTSSIIFWLFVLK